MRFTSLTLLFIFLITSVSAIPAPDKYKHYKDPGCPGVGANSCLLVPYCKNHRKRGDLFSARSLKSRGAPEPENIDSNLTDALSPSLPSFFTTRKLDVNWKRTRPSVVCGALSCPVKREISDRFLVLAAGVFYDFIIDYPYNGATGGLIGIFAQLTIAGAARIVCLGYADTDTGGVRFTFRARGNAAWYCGRVKSTCLRAGRWAGGR